MPAGLKHNASVYTATLFSLSLGKMKYFGDSLFAHWYSAFCLTFIFFSLLYFLSAFSGLLLERYMRKKKIGLSLGEPKAPSQQIKREIGHSVVSIFIFALQSIPLQIAYTRGIVTIGWAMDISVVIVEILILFIWNEIHFYIIHRMLHSKLFFSRVHYVHHQSNTPTVFSTYSFHWIEAFLLGTVIYMPLFLFPFQYIALLSLPVISIALNTLGHWNYDMFPNRSSGSLLKFTYRHNGHHKFFKGNYGFFLPIFDSVFGTNLKKHE